MTALSATAADLRARVAARKRAGRSIGFVPTMGALHRGHGALLDAARAGSDYVVASVFVNPTQFDRRDDFERYARTLDADLAFCAARGVDLVFAPPVEEIYPPGECTSVEVSGLTDHLCGKFRPGHFRGVATVVAKLFVIVAPDRAWFGEKDTQQLAVVRRMAHDLRLPVEIVGVPTVREPDGLALSSRNDRLSPAERSVAPALYRALEAARCAVEAGSADPLRVRAAADAVLAEAPQLRLEYCETVDPETMAPVLRIAGPVRIAAAAWLGGTRLIDNVAAAPPAASS